MEGKCPKNGREYLLAFITVNNKRTLAVTDGRGDAYKVYGEGYQQYNSKCKPENKYHPDEYEFERFLSGFDF